MEKNNYRRIRVGSRDEVVERWGDKEREVLVERVFKDVKDGDVFTEKCIS